MVQLLGMFIALIGSLLLGHGPAWAVPPVIPPEFQSLTWTYDSSPENSSSESSSPENSRLNNLDWERNNTGPSHWGELDPSFGLCDRGQQQSPINLQGAVPTDLPNLELHYQTSPVQILNNGRTLQVNYEPGSYLELEGKRFDLLQFHFHHPSEHGIEGQDYPMELHLVHRDRQGKLAVIGIMIESGRENAALSGVWNNLVPAYTVATATSAQINAGQLLPSPAIFYRYGGSLTTPPCSESVTWIVMVHPIQLSPQQISAFTQLLPANNRPRQASHGRALQLDSSP